MASLAEGNALGYDEESHSPCKGNPIFGRRLLGFTPSGRIHSWSVSERAALG